MLKIEAEKPGKPVVLNLEGVFDLDGVKSLKDAMQDVRRSGSVFIVLDFTRVQQVQSTCLKEMLTPLRALILVQGRAGFCGMSQGVHRIIKTAPFYQSIDVFETKEEAVKKFEELASVGK